MIYFNWLKLFSIVEKKKRTPHLRIGTSMEYLQLLLCCDLFYQSISLIPPNHVNVTDVVTHITAWLPFKARLSQNPWLLQNTRLRLSHCLSSNSTRYCVEMLQNAWLLQKNAIVTKPMIVVKGAIITSYGITSMIHTNYAITSNHNTIDSNP